MRKATQAVVILMKLSARKYLPSLFSPISSAIDGSFGREVLRYRVALNFLMTYVSYFRFSGVLFW